MTTQTNTPVLYSFRRCPYAIRARLALWYAGVDFELREVVLKDKPAELFEVSPKGTVPVLLVDGLVIEESLDIMHWALTQNDPDDWSVATLSHALIERNDDYFKHYLDRYKYFDRYPEKPQTYYLQQTCHFLEELERSLTLNWLASKTLSALDIAVFPFVRQFAFVNKAQFDKLPYPNVQKWLTKLLGSDLFQSVMLKYPAWQPDQEPLMIRHQKNQ
ncbi:MAG: glutathione S-transferase [Acidiferrobacterales bacterium]|nr:glutathione S-transferase [Acidiferrobacterales bacterium]